jgi:hypothetical protein
MVAKLIACLMLPFLVNLCNAAVTGIVSSNMTDGSHLYLPVKIQSNTKIQLQFPDKKGRLKCCLRISGNYLTSVPSGEAASDAISGDLLFHYKLKPNSYFYKNMPFVGIAVVGNAKILQIKETELSIKTRDQKISASLCTSQEGVHVTSRYGDKILSDAYLALGYSLEKPSCVN